MLLRKRLSKMIPRGISTRDSTVSVYLSILFLGIFVLYFSLWHGPNAQIVGTINIPAMGSGAQTVQVSLLNRTSSRGLILTGLAMSLITVSVLEGLKYFLRLVHHYVTMKGMVEDFFGTGAYARSDKGLIVIQCDNIDRLLTDATSPTHTTPTTISHRSRSYKARDWANRWDMRGAASIRERFRRDGLRAPEFVLVTHESNKTGRWYSDEDESSIYSRDSQCPFVMSMGLGFTSQSLGLISDLSWIRIERESEVGDLVFLHNKLYPEPSSMLWPVNKYKDFKLALKDGRVFERLEHDELVPLIPCGWDINDWEISSKNCDDYAIILRRTYTFLNRAERQVHFVVAGFTEKSTAIGAKYFADKWDDLYRDYVKSYALSANDNYGDFLLVIRGKSSSDEVANWKEAFPVIKGRDMPQGLIWPHRQFDEEGSLVVDPTM